MLITVRQGQTPQNYYYINVEVGLEKEDDSKKVAFRAVYHRMEESYQELGECTRRIGVNKTIGPEAAELLLAMRP